MNTRTVLISSALVTLALLLLGVTLAKADDWDGRLFVQGQDGPTWYQSDANSNHKAWAQALEVGWEFDNVPLTLIGSYLQSEMQDGGWAQDVRNLTPPQHLSYDYEYATYSFFAMPTIKFGNFTFAAGPGIGLLRDYLDLRVDDGRSQDAHSFQDNYSLRADLHYAVTDNLAVGFTYRHDYFEVQLPDRDTSDYEVNQDRVYYLADVRWTF